MVAGRDARDANRGWHFGGNPVHSGVLRPSTAVALSQFGRRGTVAGAIC
jgi:hypothetical protein